MSRKTLQKWVGDKSIKNSGKASKKAVFERFKGSFSAAVGFLT